MMDDYEKISRAGLQWGAVEHNTGKGEFSPQIFFGDQVVNKEFGIRKSGNEVEHIRIA